MRGMAALATGALAGSAVLATSRGDAGPTPMTALAGTAAAGSAALLGGQLLRGPGAQVLRAAGTGALLAAGIGGLLAITRRGEREPSAHPTANASPRPAPAKTSAHAPAPAPERAATTAPQATAAPSVDVPAYATGAMLGVGDSGPAVAALKDRLADLDYAVDTGDDEYTWLTRDAVMAFQKVNGLERDGTAGPLTQAALRQPRAPQLGTGPADRVDVDLSDQVLVVVRGGEVAYIVNATTGDPNHPDGQGEVTPVGTWTVERQIEGIRDAPLGRIYWPSYFHGGIAVHGSGSILPERASHGCVRVPRWLEERIHRDMPIGSSVVVHD